MDYLEKQKARSVSPGGLFAKKSAIRWRAFVRRNLSAYLFLLPALLVFTFFVWYPIVLGFIVSFQRIDLINPADWVGWENFREVMGDPLFAVAWRNTLQYTLYTLLFGYLVPIVLALAVNELRKSVSYFRLAFYLPVMLPPVVSVFLWKWLYNPDSGLLNALLELVHIAPQPWLQSPNTAMISIVIVATWAGAGGAMLIYLAALQGVPAHLYDAAEVDGASVFRKLWHVTLPQIRGVMLLLFVLQIISSMQVFTEPFAMTSGGPVHATTTVLLLIYQYAFQEGSFGKASAAGVLLFIALVVFSLLYFLVTRRINKGVN
ncbi:sugar ABC transporter permease [Reticulibacter mediterranei]|uniref:Sugar ABC transporter permease n=1 Tax=Reticulibacter mediterranei TaxID=2778369 RepID=A0A8J3IGY4_9CHLR|nr:sugar ABC transporter permease [Reticulibacter mediterranei]GHO91054.1 sugar ABC transporter permease [Reticulibacter mediterranei]